MSESSSTSSSKRLGRSDWLKAAITVMIESSVEQVRVERLATILRTSKGSFYWHFKDRNDLLTAILEYWRERSTFALTQRLAEIEPAPDRQLLLFMELPVSSARASRAADLELAIMGWARRSEEVRRAVAEVDQARTNHIAKLFARLGIPEADATHRAHQAYAGLRYIAQRHDLDLEYRKRFIFSMHANLVNL